MKYIDIIGVVNFVVALKALRTHTRLSCLMGTCDYAAIKLKSRYTASFNLQNIRNK